MSESRAASASPRRRPRFAPTTVAFGALLLAGLALRIFFTESTAYPFNSDEAVVYLMAKHVAHGEFPAFYWGQFYGGTLLQTVAGVVMIVVGPSLLVLAIVSA